MFAQLQEAFAQRGVKLLALSTNNEPNGKGEYVTHEEWVKDVDKISDTPLKFPIINDQDGTLSRLYNVLDEKDVKNLNADNDIAEGLAFKSRHIFVIGPKFKGKHHFRLIFNYPAAVGFNTAEVLRIVDCLQTADLAGIRTPANWIPGNDVVIPPKVSDEEARAKFSDFESLTPYLRFTSLSVKDTSIEKIEEVSKEEAIMFQEVNA
jgi:alkyl hydroperoxide reductase subunit AhpC